MSLNKNYTQIPNEIIRGNLSNKAFRLYCLLRSYNPSFPSHQKIIEHGFPKNSIKASIDELVSKGLITYEKGNSFKKSNRYYFIDDETKWRLYNSISIDVKAVRNENGEYSKSTTTENVGSITPLLVGDTTPRTGAAIRLINKTNIKKSITAITPGSGTSQTENLSASPSVLSNQEETIQKDKKTNTTTPQISSSHHNVVCPLSCTLNAYSNSYHNNGCPNYLDKRTWDLNVIKRSRLAKIDKITKVLTNQEKEKVNSIRKAVQNNTTTMEDGAYINSLIETDQAWVS